MSKLGVEHTNFNILIIDLMEVIWGSRSPHFLRGIPILENNEFPFADLVSHVLPLDQIANGFEALNGAYKLGDQTVIKIATGSQST